MKRLHLIIHGDVQGVGFRWYTMREAEKLGLVGWVKNKTNGTVEIVAEGEDQLLQKFKEWCEKGVSSARVERVDAEMGDVEEIQFEDFKIVYT